MKYRKEKDSIGIVKVPAEKYWAAQTQRSKQNFKIGGQQMPMEFDYTVICIILVCVPDCCS